MKDSQLNFLISQLYALTAVLIICFSDRDLPSWCTFLFLNIIGCGYAIRSVFLERNENQ